MVKPKSSCFVGGCFTRTYIANSLTIVFALSSAEVSKLVLGVNTVWISGWLVKRLKQLLYGLKCILFEPSNGQV